MDFINEQALFVITGYSYPTIEDFISSYKSSSNCSKIMELFDLMDIPMKINGKEIPKDKSPIAVFYHADKDHQIRFNRIMQQLEIATKCFNSDIDYLEDVICTFAQLRLHDIKEFNINFMLNYNKGLEKLCFFNKNISNKLGIFKFNTGFEISLPVNLIKDFGCNCLYDISKVNTENEDEHIYEIAACYNYIFKTDIANSEERLQELKSICNKIRLVYQHYLETSEEIIKL